MKIQHKCAGLMVEPTNLSATYAVKLAGTEGVEPVGATNHPSTKWLTQDPALVIILGQIMDIETHANMIKFLYV